MQCECTPLSKDERAQGEIACGEDCLNRLLITECSSRCPNGDYCSNRRFQRKQHADVEVILTDKKGWGLRAAKDLPSNTFVVEYRGEVLDREEFKAWIKEYAWNKNIHYYFMALKNDEIIDAIQKGNCSRFMNHSCEPNCEAQKWIVNGQLKVAVFTTKLVPSGSVLTFDYQFQRYGKEAQKCFCGSANCRGYLGGENRVSIRAAGGKMKKERSRKKDSVDRELEALMDNGEGLSDKNQVLSLSLLMVRIETLEQKLTCLKPIQNTHSQSCLKSFLERYGLSLLGIWMAELGDGQESNQKLQKENINTLEHLPIPTKTMLEESKVLPIIECWSQTKTAIPPLSEGNGYFSENTSHAHTPLNTPGPSTKLSTEADTDTPKKLMFRRLKIVSENSMDSAISDATIDSEITVDASKLPKCEPEADTEIEPKESNGTKLEEPIAEETPSQDEEEGVAGVESERSQEQPDKTVDTSDLATKLLDSWKDLQEGTKRPDDRYDTLTSKKKVRIKDHNKLSAEEHRKLFEQEVAQQEAYKQQQQMQNLGMTSPLPHDSLGYNVPHHPFAGYPPGYPMQAYVDPSNPNAGKTARDPEGKIYYYPVITRQTQRDPPTWESPQGDASPEHEAEVDLGTPTYDENPMNTSKKPETAEADTSSELAKKSKEVFRKEMSQFIVRFLNPYRKPDCKVGRITTTEDFKRLARKLTHGVMSKELKYCKNPEDLECNENVKLKTKKYTKKYMQKFGAVYKP
ncbi:Histone-Lysine N-Methyltransferase Setd2 [Manis pentadactyla]|nr:Histone-Lysine N-Methyltransferase Setd2 [Manis pentadactyla]